jgi:hypothetical protein
MTVAATTHPRSFQNAVAFTVPAKHNPRLSAVVDRINADEELRQLWRCSNVNAADRLRLGDHGETHVRIVANASLRLLRLLLEAGYASGVVHDHGLERAEAEVVVVLAAALHDLGLSIHADRHAQYGLALAQAKLADLLHDVYEIRERTVLQSEILHAISSHHQDVPALTLEAGVLEVADVLDMSKGRVASVAEGDLPRVESVHILRGTRRPVRVEIRVARANGLPSVEHRLQERLARAGLAESIEFTARIEGAPDHPPISIPIVRPS